MAHQGLLARDGVDGNISILPGKTPDFLYNSKSPMNFAPDYLKLYEFEKFQTHDQWRQWMHSHWQLSVYAAVVYVVLVFYVQGWMRDRKPFKLRKYLAAWSLSLAVFSTVGFFRSAPELLVSVWNDGGFHKSVCFLENHNAATSLWGLLFTLSKIVEFGDTAFIVLRKQRLIFLHWYHHVTVCIFCWFTFAENDPSSRWFCTLNYLVHALMYSYYTLRSLQVKVPRKFAMFLTTLQISQMAVGIAINIHSYSVLVNGGECERNMFNIYLALIMYFSYLLLFANFFYNAYMKRGSTKNDKKLD